MKKFVLSALLVLASATAFASGENTSMEDLQALHPGVGQTQIGGCTGGVQVIQNGENTEYITSGDCYTQSPNVLASVFNKTFATYELAQAHCRAGEGYVQSVLNWNFQVAGFICTPTNDVNGQ